MSKLTHESRRRLLERALRDLSHEEVGRLLREVKQKISGTVGIESQVRKALERNIHRLYGKTEEEFIKWLTPLDEKAKMIDRANTDLTPFLLVFPASSLIGRTMEQKRRALLHTLRFQGKSFRPRWSLRGFDTDRVETPALPYLALHVELGIELAALPGDDSGSYASDPAVIELTARCREPLTLDEGLALSAFFESEVAYLPGLRLPGTRHFTDENCPLLEYEGEDAPAIDDMEASMVGNPDENWYRTPYAVPSCTVRVAL